MSNDTPVKVCNVPDCESILDRLAAHGMCRIHYKRLWRTGSTGLKPLVAESACAVTDCGRAMTAPTGRGMCSLHYGRWQKHGDPLHERTRVRRVDVEICTVEDCPKVIRAKDLCIRHYKLSRTKRWPAECTSCHVEFQANGQTWLYCSAACRKRDERAAHLRRGEVRRARLADVLVEDFSRVEIFNRDNWVCGICAGVIDRTLQWPNQMSVSLDHVVPIARGGEHSRANTQASHLFCNISKGARVA